MANITYVDFMRKNNETKEKIQLLGYKPTTIETVNFLDTPATCKIVNQHNERRTLDITAVVENVNCGAWCFSNPSKLRNWVGFKPEESAVLYWYSIKDTVGDLHYVFEKSTVQASVRYDTYRDSYVYTAQGSNLTFDKTRLGKLQKINGALYVVLLEDNIEKAKKVLRSGIVHELDNVKRNIKIKQKELNDLNARQVDAESLITDFFDVEN